MILFANPESGNTQIFVNSTSQTNGGRYNETLDEYQKSDLREDNLIILLLQLLQTEDLHIKNVIPLLVVLNNLFSNSQNNADYKANFEKFIQQTFSKKTMLNFENVINNLSDLLNEKFNKDIYDNKLRNDKNFFSFIEYLQKSFLFAKIINQECYCKILKSLADFKKDSHLSLQDKLFRYFMAANTGIGIGSVILGWGPMALIGLLGFVGFLLSPLGAGIITAGFGIAAFGIGGALFYNLLKNYKKEDQVLMQEVQNAENHVYSLAHKETILCKKHYRLNYKKFRLLRQLTNPELDLNGRNNDYTNLQKPSLKSPSPQVHIRWRVAMSFLGTLATVWGFPTLLCSFFGISLMVSGIFLPGGLLLAGAAVIIACAAAYKTYAYDKKSSRYRGKFELINKEGVNEIKKRITDEKNQIKRLQREKEILKLQILNEQQSEQIKEIGNEFQEIEESKLMFSNNAIEEKPKDVYAENVENKVTLFTQLNTVQVQRCAKEELFIPSLPSRTAKNLKV